MKKIITLVTSALLFTSVFAQYDKGNQNEYDKGSDVAYNNRFKNDDHRRNDRYAFNSRERDLQIAQINREYDKKIVAVKHRWFMSRSKKEALICSLEDQRRQELRMIYAKFNQANNRYSDYDSRRHW